MASDNILSVSEADFEYEVIAYSHQTPVVVDFWAEWCGPCKMIGPLLEKLAHEAQGAFRLAKLDVDQNPNLALRFNVRSIPSVKAFRDGQVVAEFVGAQPEPRIREFLRQIAPSQADLVLEKAQSLLETQEWQRAELTFRQFLAKNSDQPAGLLGLAKSQLMQGKIPETVEIMKAFPPSREYAAVEIILPLAQTLQRIQTMHTFSEEPLEAAYINALRLLLRGNVEATMDGILEVLRQNKRFRDSEPRRMMLAIFEILGENNPLTRQYRNELAMVLF